MEQTGARRHGAPVCSMPARGTRMLKMDAQLLFVTAIVSFVATVAIVFMINMVQPGLDVFKGGTALFIYIGVFTANLIIEAARQRSDRKRNQ